VRCPSCKSELAEVTIEMRVIAEKGMGIPEEGMVGYSKAYLCRKCRLLIQIMKV